MKHGLKSLVLCVILAMLCAGLLVGTALAEDISLGVKIWNEEEKDFVLSESNEITVQTCEEFVLVAQTPSGTQYSINGIDEWSWEEGEGEVSHSIAAEGEREYYLSRYDADNEKWVMLDGEGDPKVVVTAKAENGNLATPEIDGMPATVSATAESFSFSFKEITGATLHNPWVVYVNSDEEVVLCDYYSDAEEEQEGFAYDAENGVYTVTVKPDEGVLAEGGWVIAYVWVEGPGYNAAWVEHGVPVIGETVDGTWLTIDGKSNETVEAQSRQSLNYRVAIPEREDELPARAEIYIDRWHDIGVEDGLLDYNPDGEKLGDLSFECDWLESGEYDILVRAAWEGEDGEVKWYYGNVVHVSVTGEQIKAPEVSLESESVTRGEQLEVHFTWGEESLKHVRNCYVNLHNDEWEETWDYAPAETIQVPTATLEAGDYRLDVWFETEPGYDSCSTDEIVFSVTAGEAAVFTVDKTEVETKESFILSAYVPNANGLRIVYNSDEDEVCDESEGNGLYVSWDFDHPGEYEFTLQQPDGEDWTAVEGVDPITVTVNSVGEIDEPTVSLPVVVTKTEEEVPFTVTVEAHPYEESEEAPTPYINVEIWPNDEDVEEPIWGEYDTTERAFSLPMDELEVGSYRINVYAWLKGYDCCGHEEQFEVIEAPEAGAPTMRLTVNDEEESVEVQAGAEYEVTYAIDGDREQYTVEALYLMWDDEWQEASNTEDEGFYFVGDEWGGTLNWSDGSVQRKLVMKATVQQGEDESFDIYSNEVVLNVTAEGQVPTPEVTLEGLKDGAIAQGGDITVKVTLSGENRDKIAMIDLNLFSVNGEDEEQINGIRLYSGDPGEETMTRAIPTNGLEPGSYRVQVWVGAEVGYDSNETDYEDESLRFEVTERAEDAPASLSAGVSEVTVGETFLLSGYVPNANGVALFVSRGDDNWLDRTWEDTDSFNTDYTLDRAGNYEFTLGVWDDEKEDWEKLTDAGTSVTITGTSKGQLAQSEITAADIFEGEGFTFSFKPVENANGGYFVRVYADVENGWDEHVLLDEYYEAGNVSDPMTLEISAEAFEGYETDTAFIVFVEAQGRNYDWSQSEKSFALRADSAFEASTVEANVGEAITLTASARGATQLNITRNGEPFNSVSGSIGSFEITENEPGVYTYALTAEGSKEAFGPIEIVVTHEGSVENPENLATLELPQGLEAVAEEAFSGTAIESVIIHDEVTEIGKNAFADCKNLQYVFIPASVETIAEDAFSGCSNLVRIDRER